MLPANPRARADCNASLGSPEVRAALSNVLLLRLGLGLERERGYIAEAGAKALEPVGIEHLWEFRSRLVVPELRIGFRNLHTHPFRDGDENAKLPSGGAKLIIGAFPRIY